MIRTLFTTLATVLALASLPAQAGGDPPRVRLSTSAGDVVLELAREQAPATVENFLGYVKDGFYDGTIFHRIIDGFMIQGGGFTPDFDRKSTRDPIRNEATNGLKNLRGTIAMARTGDPHCATAQFFINAVDNPALDPRAPSGRDWGYAVFGRVVEGMDVVDRIKGVATGRRGPYRNVPAEPVIIRSAAVVEQSS